METEVEDGRRVIHQLPASGATVEHLFAVSEVVTRPKSARSGGLFECIVSVACAGQQNYVIQLRHTCACRVLLHSGHWAKVHTVHGGC